MTEYSCTPCVCRGTHFVLSMCVFIFVRANAAYVSVAYSHVKSFLTNPQVFHAEILVGSEQYLEGTLKSFLAASYTLRVLFVCMVCPLSLTAVHVRNCESERQASEISNLYSTAHQNPIVVKSGFENIIVNLVFQGIEVKLVQGIVVQQGGEAYKSNKAGEAQECNKTSVFWFLVCSFSCKIQCWRQIGTQD